MGASVPTGCCSGRQRGVFCRNERLLMYLERLRDEKKEFDSIWIYKHDDDGPLTARSNAGQGMDSASRSFVVFLQRIDGGGSHKPVRKVVRLEWGYDGLAFSEDEHRPPEAGELLLVASKVFKPAVPASEVLRKFEDLQHYAFDREYWNSERFCFHLFDLAPGKEYEYRIP
eukprot:TRINITY_DN22930_c0_g1_i2.p1 TRINITY_DN22930_c0_g1~~TRINITY_DN22930_c0_g1_i2.p1  ORF type:complete len:171 (+),score=42.30 TRINITY_DN22930_c0_g1_i2:68-580(+)